MYLQDVPWASPYVVLREEFDDWAVLFNPDTAKAIGTNPTGVVVWRLVNGQNTVEQICNQLQNHCSDVPQAATDEILTFINLLAEQGFVGLAVEQSP